MQMFQDWLKNTGVAEKYIIALNFEERENQTLLSWEEVYDFIVNKLSKDRMNYVFLDEVQMVPQFERLVDALYVKSNVDLYITGSNAYLLSSELGTLLSGRYIAINLRPFSFSEYMLYFSDDGNTDRLFRQYMNSSSFPEVVNLSQTAPEMANEYLKSLYESVVVKDIVKRNHLRKFDTLKQVLTFIFDSVGWDYLYRH